ncbi:MAG: ImmA/IrrE family metallo-endopeptidase [Cytophagaceae bacterium]
MNKNKRLQIEMEKKTNAFRQQFGFSPTEPIPLHNFLLKQNVLCLFREMSEGLSGMAIKMDDMRFMMINRTHFLGRQHFTIGHELYHLFVQENFSSQRCVTGLYDKQKDDEEKKADLFSALLLLPEAGIVEFIPLEEISKGNEISLETLLKIQHYYQVSFKAVVYRLVELEFIDKDYFDKYMHIKSKARALGYSTDIYEPTDKDVMIGDYGIIANKLYNEEKISESYFLELMNAIQVDPLALEDSHDEE